MTPKGILSIENGESAGMLIRVIVFFFFVNDYD